MSAEQKQGGYLKLYRRALRDVERGGDPLWNERRVWSRAEAWVYLIASAAHAPHDRRLRSGNFIRLERGEFVAPLRVLAAKWGWTKDRVARFLALLADSETGLGRVVRRERDIECDTYLIVNYDTYQGGRDSERAGDETPRETSARARRDTPGSPLPAPIPSSPPHQEAGGRRGSEGERASAPEPAALPIQAPIPNCLGTVEFLTVWQEFRQWRVSAKRKRMTAKAEQLTLADLAIYGPAIAVAALRMSMKNDWQGVFPEKVNQRVANGRPRGTSPQVDDQLAEYVKGVDG